MRIAYYVPRATYLESCPGGEKHTSGSGMFITNVLTGLRDRGHEVKIILGWTCVASGVASSPRVVCSPRRLWCAGKLRDSRQTPGLSTPLRFSIPTCSAGGSIPQGTYSSVAKDQASKESRRCPNRGDTCTPLRSGRRYSERTRSSRSEQWGNSEERCNISAVGGFLKKESASFRSR